MREKAFALLAMLVLAGAAFATTMKIPDSNVQGSTSYTIRKIEKTGGQTQNIDLGLVMTQKTTGPETQANSGTGTLPAGIAKEIEDLPPGTSGSWEITGSNTSVTSKPAIQTAIQSWGGQISMISQPENGSQTAVSIVVNPNAQEPLPGKEEIRKAMQGTEIEITEYCSYSDGFCRDYHETTFKELMQDYGDMITYEFVFYQITPNESELTAAQAAKCAEDQGRFLEMHEKLSGIRQPFDEDKIKNAAAQTSLETIAFNECLESQKYLQEIQSEQQEAIEQGIAGIPTFIINGLHVKGYKTRQFKEAFVEIAPTKPVTKTQAIKVCTTESTGTACIQAQKIGMQPTTQAIQAEPIEIEYGTEQTKQKIKVSKNGSAITIEDEEGKTVQTSQAVEVDENGLKINQKAIKVLPSQALKKVENASTTATQIELVAEEKPVYEIKAVQQTRLLWLIPIEIETKTKVNAETGSIESVEKPWWSFLTG